MSIGKQVIEPLIKLVKVDSALDAFDIYSTFYKEYKEAEAILLDSGRDFEGLGRYSFIGLYPFLKYKGDSSEDNCFAKLKHIFSSYEIKKGNDIELPFIGGAIGYLSYDVGRTLEELPTIAKCDVDMAYCNFNFYDSVIIIDNLKKHIYISALGISKNREDRIKEIEAIIIQAKKARYASLDSKEVECKYKVEAFNSNFSKKEYVDAVTRVREYIRSGDVYIANFTQRFMCDCYKEPYEVYKSLRNINPAPFAAFMPFEDCAIVSSSPERFLKITNGVVETRPIKGTRPRGRNPQEDAKNRQELIESEKDRAELLMIVDLERNDLSKVCKPHSVKVTELFKLEEYSTVFHLVSTVVGELKENKTSIDCIEACFPGGSITGAPKIRAMEIIDELEKVRRNLYTGCMGYIGFDGNVDLNIVIRTIVIKEHKAYFGVGGGITWDSDEEAEYQESLDKAKALMEVLS